MSNDYPLNCVDDLSDGFSGWFAISNAQECNDFCYWHISPSKTDEANSEGEEENDNNNDNDDGDDGDDDDDDDDDGGRYTASNTDDPHRRTIIYSPESKVTSYWVCVYDGADDKFLASQANGERWIESWDRYTTPEAISSFTRQFYPFQLFSDVLPGNSESQNVPFPYLRCQKGAGEKLKTWSGEVVKSASFWETWIVLASFIFLGELVGLSVFCRNRRARKSNENYEMVGRGSMSDEALGETVLSTVHSFDPLSDGASRTLEDIMIDKYEDDDGENDDYQDDGIPDSGTGSMSDGGSSTSRLRNILNRSAQNEQAPSHEYEQCTPTQRSITSTSFFFKRSRLSHQKLLLILQIVLIVVLNLLLAFTVSFSSVSLMEIHSNPLFKESMQRMTPACSDPNLVCPAGNENIDKQSVPWLPSSKSGKNVNVAGEDAQTTIKFSSKDLNPTNANVNQTNKLEMQPFSYIIASDAQLYWFNGEFAEMGEKNIPPECSPSDSCGRCTGNHGYSANLRLKKAWESLMTGETDGMSGNQTSSVEGKVLDGELPVPSTLVMNGDLTAYFHPHEKRAYESIYNDISGLKNYFPSLGNHDIEHMGGAKYGNDEWVGTSNCNMEHAIGYFKSSFCGEVPFFNTNRIVRYDAPSLAYSWEEGRYHFVHTHYYPTYEMASMQFRSSMQWLERDLQLAKDAGLTNVLFVHAVENLIPAMENVLLGKNVAVIIAGHTHRCLHRKCEGVYPLNEDQANNDSLEMPVEKCIPAAYDTCQVLKGENLIYTKDLAEEVTFPTKKLHNIPRTDKPLCPKPAPTFINETDNSLLCRHVIYSYPTFPFHIGKNLSEAIPIFWSGSSSFETFLRADFYDDRIVINSMATSEDAGVGRVIDLHNVPSPRYPYHNVSDLEEAVIRF